MVTPFLRISSRSSVVKCNPAVGAAAGDYRKHVQMPVLLASMDIRRYVRRLIEGEHYRLPVVSYQELTPEISVQPMNRIRL